MNKNPEITVIITCFNYGHFIEDCLKSVLSQTYSNYEIIIIDDGSTDNTNQVIQKYLKIPYIKYIYQENAGQANAKNKGIQYAKGQFLAFLDADDLWVEDKLEKQIKLFNKASVGVVYSKANLIDEYGVVSSPGYWGEALRPRSGRVVEWLFIDNFVWFSSSMVRKDCFEKHGIFDETLQMGIDWDLWLRLSIYYEFDFVEEPLLYYRMGHTGQMSKNIETRFACSERIMARFLEKNPKLLSKGTIRKAYVYSYGNRGRYYRKINRWRSCKFFLRALTLNPFDRDAFWGLIKAIVWFKYADSTGECNR